MATLLSKEVSVQSVGGSNNAYKFKLEVIENSTSTVNNTSNVTINFYGAMYPNWGFSGFSAPMGTIKIDGVEKVSEHVNSINSTTYKVLATWAGNIIHGDNGEKSINVSASFGPATTSYLPKPTTINEIVNLTSIARYTSISSFYLSTKTETSLSFYWKTANNISKLEYSFNGTKWTTYSSGLNTNRGTMILNNLNANTNYSVYIRVTRYDSGLTTTSNQVTVDTYDYPYISETPNFTVGQTLTMQVYNPLERRCQIYITPNDSSDLGGDIITGTSISGYITDYFTNGLKQASPDSPTNSYAAKCVCLDTDTTKISPTSGTYTIPEIAPEFNNFEYLDSSDVALITEDNQSIVKNKSILKVKISSANKMIAKDYATPNRYEISCGNRSKSLDYSENDAEIELGTINSSGIMNIVVKAIDTRGFSKTINKTITVIDYTNIVQNNDIYRLNNFENETKLKCEGTFSLVEVNGVAKNNIEEIKYRYKESNGEYPTDYTSITPTLNGNKYSSLLQTFDLDNQKSFVFEVLAKDKFGWSEPIELIVDEGIPIMYINADKKNVGIGCINEHEEYSLEVKGKIYSSEDASFCNMSVSGIQDIASGVTVSDFTWTGGVSNEGFIASIDQKALLIPKGTKVIEITGKVSGHGSVLAWIDVKDEEGNRPAGFEATSTEVLAQPSGNGYVSLSLPTRILKLSENKSYKVTLNASGYNSVFSLNNGFSKTYGTWIQAKKVK